MKNKISIKVILASLAIVLTSIMLIDGCKTPEAISTKSGAQLWGENCNRCHNAPDPTMFSDDQWDAATEHMHQKALLTDQEIDKIRTFLKQAN
ncbi:MAG TPA: cytochrome c [Bacteroidia bacterium]|nr:cytochrome c [Bacteroidia bacterium]